MSLSLILDKNIGNSSSYKNINELMQDPIDVLPYEIALKVFSNFNLATLGQICTVSKDWKVLANEPILWKKSIYREIAFGNDKWAQCFGKDVVKDEDREEEFSSLPWKDFIEDCNKFKNIFPEKNAKDTLMLVRIPKTLNGGLTLKSLGELARKYFVDNPDGYKSVWNSANVLFGKTIDKSRWVLMTKDILPGSKNESYDEQQKIIFDLAGKSLNGYEVPETLEAATCILSQYFLDSKTFLFTNKIHTFCKETIRNFQISVGAFDSRGLSIHNDRGVIIGVAALRKF